MRSSTFPRPIKDPLLWVLFVLALFLRLAFVGYHAHLGWHLRYDPAMYLALAEGMGHGVFSMFHPQDIPDTIKMPGYPALIHLLGGRIGSLLVVQAILSAAKVPLVFLLARSIGLRVPLALAAATLMAIEPIDILLAGQVLTESIFNTLLLAGFVLIFRNAGWKTLLLASLLFASAAWVRPNGLGLLLLVGVGGYLVLRRSWVRSAAFTALGIALLLPWAWRNQRTTGRFYLGDSAAVAAAYYQVPDVLRAAHDPRAGTYTKALRNKAASMDWEDRESFHGFFDGLRSATHETLITYPITWSRVQLGKTVRIFLAPGRGHIDLFFGHHPIASNILLLYSGAFSLLFALSALFCATQLRHLPPWLWLFLLCTAYLLFSGAVTTADARFKSPAIPLMLVTSAWAIQRGIELYRSGASPRKGTSW